jgi:hypothetical protein
MPVSTFELKLEEGVLYPMVVLWVAIGAAAGRGLQVIGRLMRPDIHLHLDAVIWVTSYAAISFGFMLYSANALNELRRRMKPIIFLILVACSLVAFGYLFFT